MYRDFPQRLAYEQLLLSRGNNGGSGKKKQRAPTFDLSVLERAYERAKEGEGRA
jgi:hypothetical protein